MNNIILCGMMGAGKTTVGVEIAALTGRRWYDTDQLIEDRHGKISDLFEYYGEEYFRKQETELVRELSEKEGLVLSTGGGLVLKKENSELLKKKGVIVYLRASFGILEQRLKIGGERPLLKGGSQPLAEKLKEMLAVRGPIYESVADYIVDVEDAPAVINAEKVLSVIGNTEGKKVYG